MPNQPDAPGMPELKLPVQLKSDPNAPKQDANGQARTLPTFESDADRKKRLAKEEAERKAAEEKARQKSYQEKQARGQAVAGEAVSDRKERLTSDSPTPLGPELEYRLWRKMRNLQNLMGDITSAEAEKRGLDISRSGKRVLDQASTWNQTAQSPEWKALGDTLDKLDGMDESIRDIDVQISGLASGDPQRAVLLTNRTTLINTNKKEREKLEKLKSEQVQKLDAVHATIFADLTEGCQAYAFLSQQRVAVAEQIGIAITNNGKQELNFTLPTEVQIDKLLTMGVPAEDAKILKYVIDRLGLKGKGQEIMKAVATLSVPTLTALGFGAGTLGAAIAGAPLTTVGLVAGAGVVATGGAAVGTAAAIYGGHAILKAIGTDWEHWKVGLSPGKPGEELKFTLSYIPRAGGALPENANDPIASHFAGLDAPSRQAAVRFLEESEVIRAAVAKSQRVDLWMVDLGEPNIDQTGGRGRGFIIDGLRTRHQKLILETEFNGKTYSQLTSDQKRYVMRQASDLANTDYARGEAQRVLREILLREAQGREAGQREGWAPDLTAREAQLREGKVVQSPQEKPQDPAALEAEKTRLQNEEQRQNTIKTRLAALRDEIDTGEGALVTAQDTKKDVEAKKGKKAVPDVTDVDGNVTTKGEAGEGEIGDWEKQKIEAEKIKGELIASLGSLQSDGKFNGLLGQIHISDADLAIAVSDERITSNEYESRRREAEKIEAQLLSDESKPRTYQGKLNSEKLTAEKRTELQTKLDRLNDKDKTADGSVAQAKEAWKKAGETKGVQQAINDTLHTEFKDTKAKIDDLRGSETKDGSIASFAQKIREADEAIRTAGQTVIDKQRALDKLVKERDGLLIEFGFGTGSIPADAVLVARVQQTTQKIQDVTAEIGKLTDEAGKAKTPASQKDLDRADGIGLASKAVTDETLNGILGDIIDRNITLEELANTLDDSGYRMLLKKLFGPEALMEGKDGKYEVARRLISKSMIAQTIIREWKLEDRMDEYLSTPQLQAHFAQFRIQQSRIRGLSREIGEIDRTKKGWEREVNRRRDEISTLTENNNVLMATLYDQKLHTLLTQDQVRTASVVRTLVNDMYTRCQRYNPYEEVLGTAPELPTQETVKTPDGNVTIRPAARKEDGSLVDRGEVKVAQLGGIDGVNVQVNFDASTSITGGQMYITAEVPKTKEYLNRLPDQKPANFPPELAFFIYDASNNKRSLADINTYIDGLVPDAAAAQFAGIIDENVLRAIFVVDNEGPPPQFGKKKSSSEITEFTSFIDLNWQYGDLSRFLSIGGLTENFERALGRAFITGDVYRNRELFTDQFEPFQSNLFLIQNENGEFIAHFATEGQLRTIPVARLIAKDTIPGTTISLTDDEINDILENVGQAGFYAMRKA